MTRIGASQAFFNIVAQFNAEKLIRDTRSLNTVMKAVALDTFEAILKPIDDIFASIDGGLDAVRDLGMEMGDATVEFQKFYGESASLEVIKDDLIAVGEAYAMVGSEALAAGSRAAQVANLIGRQNVDLLVEQAAILAEISDLSLEEAQRGMIQLNQQAGILYGEMTRQQIMSLSARKQEIILTENSARALDTLNTIANRSVALEGDLVKTMTNFASAAHLAGDSFEFMAASSAVLLEAGEEQGTAGRALRMIYARLGGDINGARSELENMGLVLTEENGQMKTMQEVLEELHSKGWDKLNPAVKQNIAQTVAGNRHYVRFIKLMENYERVVSLTADGMLGLDSASKQAETALESNVRKLQKVEAQVENAKAAIGEGLTPMMIGAAEAERDFLRATEMLTDGLGGMGKIIGRGMGTFKVTEGFIKMGLAIQSIGIGLNMFSSVQRSLNGIEIAMANLHSKQASYLEYGVTATEKQKNLMQGMLFEQQQLNAVNKEAQIIKGETAILQKQIADIDAERLPKAERMKMLFEESKKVHFELRALGAERRIVEKDIGSKVAERAGRIEYENQMTRELLKTQKEIYMFKEGSEDAYMRQMLADFDTMNDFGENEIETLNDKNKLYRQQHTILQQIKAENEAVRVIGEARKGGLIQTLKVADIEAGKKHMAELISMYNGYNAALAAKKKKDGSLSEFDEERVASNDRMIVGIENITKALVENDKRVELSKEGFDALMVVTKDSAGQFYQSERLIRTRAAAVKDSANHENRLATVQKLRANIGKDMMNTSEALQDLRTKDISLYNKLNPLLEELNRLEGDKEAQGKKLIKIAELLSVAEKDYTTSQEGQVDVLSDRYKTNERYIKSQERAAAAQKQLAFGAANLGGILFGALGKSTAAAAASMGMMSTQVIAAGSSAANAAKDLVKAQYSMIALQRGFDGGTAAAARFKAGIMSLVVALGPLIAIGGAFYMFAKHQKKVQGHMEDFNETMQEHEATMGRLSASTKIFGEEDGLAATLGIANYELSELVGNTELTEDIMGKLANHGFDLGEALSGTVTDARDLLSVLNGMQNDSPIINEQAFSSTYADLMSNFEGFGFFKAGLKQQGSDIDAMEDLYDSLGLSFQKGLLGPQQRNYTQKMMQDLKSVWEQGRRLSEDELALVEQALDSDMLFSMVESLNGLVRGADDAAIGLADLGEESKDIAVGIGDATAEIQNLTDEIYNFSGAREELFFGGKYGNVTGSLYKQVVQQGVGTLYHKNEVIMSNNFHGFFNEREAADKIIAVLDEYTASHS